MAEHVCKIINGKGLAGDIQSKLKKKIDNFRITPKLAVILVGHDERSEVYIEFKEKAAREIGIEVKTIVLEEATKQARLERIIDELNNDENIHGILVQLPLPKHINEKRIIELVDPSKDVDGFHPTNIGRLVANNETGIIPATPKGIIRILDSINFEFLGKHFVLVGSGYLVGRPLVALLLNRQATVTICNKSTENLAELTQLGDVIVTGTGQPKIITREMVKKNATVIDAGIATADGSVIGDVDFDEVCKVVKYITPVPGGVGPMTVAMLLENTWQAMRLQNGYEDY